jgi:hypothetical protein
MHAPSMRASSGMSQSSIACSAGATMCSWKSRSRSSSNLKLANSWMSPPEAN